MRQAGLCTESQHPENAHLHDECIAGSICSLTILVADCKYLFCNKNLGYWTLALFYDIIYSWAEKVRSGFRAGHCRIPGP